MAKTKNPATNAEVIRLLTEGLAPVFVESTIHLINVFHAATAVVARNGKIDPESLKAMAKYNKDATLRLKKTGWLNDGEQEEDGEQEQDGFQQQDDDDEAVDFGDEDEDGQQEEDGEQQQDDDEDGLQDDDGEQEEDEDGQQQDDDDEAVDFGDEDDQEEEKPRKSAKSKKADKKPAKKPRRRQQQQEDDIDSDELIDDGDESGSIFEAIKLPSADVKKAVRSMAKVQDSVIRGAFKDMYGIALPRNMKGEPLRSLAAKAKVSFDALMKKKTMALQAIAEENGVNVKLKAADKKSLEATKEAYTSAIIAEAIRVELG